MKKKKKKNNALHYKAQEAGNIALNLCVWVPAQEAGNIALNLCVWVPNEGVHDSTGQFMNARFNPNAICQDPESSLSLGQRIVDLMIFILTVSTITNQAAVAVNWETIPERFKKCFSLTPFLSGTTPSSKPELW